MKKFRGLSKKLNFFSILVVDRGTDYTKLQKDHTWNKRGRRTIEFSEKIKCAYVSEKS